MAPVNAVDERDHFSEEGILPHSPHDLNAFRSYTPAYWRINIYLSRRRPRHGWAAARTRPHGVRAVTLILHNVIYLTLRCA
jgi:hypothetical protein